jgi:hypothetical protein
LLCPTTKLLTLYFISITKYIATLYQVWCSYHSYVKKVIRVRILWHQNGPFNLSSGHSSCFFKGARPSFNGLTCYPCLFRMLSIDHSYISHSFPTWWSAYSSWCSGTCRDRYLSFIDHITGYVCVVTWGCPITCFIFQKSNNAIFSPNVIFFDEPITWTKIYFDSNKCSFGCWVNTSSLLCKSNNRGLVINSF